ncbi:MAG: DUF2971 domain-containing protein [Solimonas sp.]
MSENLRCAGPVVMNLIDRPATLGYRQLLKQFTSLSFTYKCMNAFHLTKAEHALAALRNQRIKIARINELNDPFELYGAALSEKGHRRRFRAFKDWTADRYGMLCFSRTWRNPVLWSHYADHHRGIAIEFSLHADDVSKVTYTLRRPLIDVDSATRRGRFTQDEAFRLATTKFSHWKYEDEVRLFCQLQGAMVEGAHAFQPFTERLRLVGLILGPACNVTSEEVAANLPVGMQVAVTRARLAFRTFDVVRNREHKVEFVCGVAQQ